MRFTQQLLRVMRIVAFLLLVGSLHVAGRTVSQTITLRGNNLPVERVIAEIEHQSGYVVLCNREHLRRVPPLDIDVNNEPLTTFLSRTFPPKGLGYLIQDKTIILSPAPPAALPPITVKGKVVNEAGEPVEGVTVMIKGTATGTVTNALGEFEIGEVPEKAILVFTSTAIEKLELKVNARTTLTVGIKRKISPLDEVQIIAYGETSKRLQTGNVSTVKAKDIEKQPVTNPLLALQGRVPGLFIEQATGLPGSGVTVRIQGQNSLSAGSDPLYVIDGVPYITQMLPGISDVQGRSGADGTGNPLSYINPADIESIDVLKDADATSIYGSRAAAGAILITTKKGKAGKTAIDLNIQQGWGRVGNFIKLLNTQQYLEMRHEAFKNDGIIPAPTDYDINGTWDTTRYTDWQKELIGRTAKYTNAQLSISGGNANTTFLLSGGYRRETTVFPGSMYDQKSSMHFSLNHSSSNKRLKVQFNGQYIFDDNHLIATDLTRTAMALAPVAPAPFNADGSLNWAPDAFGASSWSNPLANLSNTYRNKVNNLVSNAVISYELLPGFDAKVNGGYTNLTRNEMQLFPIVWNAPETRSFSTRFSDFNDEQLTSWIVEPQLSFKNKIAKGTLDVLAGTTFLSNDTRQQRTKAFGFSSDLLMENIGAASNLRGSTSITQYRYNALFGRVNYNWENKYILNLNVRRDGSSRFGSENLFNNFWSVGGAWLFSNQEFIKRHVSYLSFGKLRTSYGTTGNDQIGDYRFMNLYYPNTRNVPYQDVTGLASSDYPNPFLQWEETKKLQVGLDLGFVKDRILINLNYYSNRSSNQLQSYSLPIITGTTYVLANFPATIENSGWEFSVSSTNIQTKNFNWNTAFNFTLPKNKLIAYENLEQTSSASQYVIGKSFTIVHLYKSLGVDPSTGAYIFADSKGVPTSSPVYPDDATVWSNVTPTFYGGIQNSINYKGISLDFLFQFVKQRAPTNQFGDRPGSYYSGAYGSYGNQPVSVLNRWQKPGDKMHFQRFSTTYPYDLLLSYIYETQSDANYVDGSYGRLKNLSISWQIPDHWKRFIHLQYARLYVQGQNLVTISNVRGLDPETKSATTLPPLKIWSTGLQVGF